MDDQNLDITSGIGLDNAMRATENADINTTNCARTISDAPQQASLGVDYNVTF